MRSQNHCIGIEALWGRQPWLHGVPVSELKVHLLNTYWVPSACCIRDPLVSSEQYCDEGRESEGWGDLPVLTEPFGGGVWSQTQVTWAPVSVLLCSAHTEQLQGGEGRTRVLTRARGTGVRVQDVSIREVREGRTAGMAVELNPGGARRGSLSSTVPGRRGWAGTDLGEAPAPCERGGRMGAGGDSRRLSQASPTCPRVAHRGRSHCPARGDRWQWGQAEWLART